MIELWTEEQNNGCLKAAGLVATGLKSEEGEPNIRIWTFDGEPVAPPEPYDVDKNGNNRYDPLSTRLFLKRLKGEQRTATSTGDEQTSHLKNVVFHAKDKE